MRKFVFVIFSLFLLAGLTANVSNAFSGTKKSAKKATSCCTKQETAKAEKASCCTDGAACCDQGTCCTKKQAAKGQKASLTKSAKSGESCCTAGAACCATGASCCKGGNSVATAKTGTN